MPSVAGRAGQKRIGQRYPRVWGQLDCLVVPVIQEIGNALVLVLTGSGKRLAESCQRNAGAASSLHVPYSRQVWHERYCAVIVSSKVLGIA
jgi:hypothetical protein